MTVCVAAAVFGAGQSNPPAIFHGRSLMDAHNAYPEEGRYRDRLARAAGTGLTPVVIEQDVAFDARARASVVSHDTTLDGAEPTLQAHFFSYIKPLMEAALAAPANDRWPLLVLHLDFKTNEREHHRAVWDLLIAHQSWLTTAPLDGGGHVVSAFTPGPLLVLTENGTDQEKDFSEWAATAGRYLIFGTIPSPAIPAGIDDTERARLLASMPPSQLIPAAATSYRRWVNFPWAVVEPGGQRQAGAWTIDDRSRLDQIVGYAHQQGLLIRFYTLNGHAGSNSRGWSDGYNFGSLDAVRLRWQAAIRSRVDLIATDQYEDFALVLRALQR
jgi:hypothetical protein